jgi:iron complex outermembrane receptor protein
MNKCILNVVLVLFFIFFSMPVIAAEEKDAKHEEVVTTPEVVVVASPIIEGNQVNDYGSQVTIVLRKQISDLNAQDLPSALRRTPGVVISRYNPAGSFGSDHGGAVYIRGMGSSRLGADAKILKALCLDVLIPGLFMIPIEMTITHRNHVSMQERQVYWL